MGTQSVSDTLYVIKGDHVNLTCESWGNPAPRYQWAGRPDGLGNLMISNITSTVTASCTARNTMIPTVGQPQEGDANASLTVRVRGKYSQYLSIYSVIRRVNGREPLFV